MANIDQIRTLTVKAKVEGVQESSSQLQGLAAAGDEVTASSSRTEKATLSVERAFQRLQRQLDDAVKSQEQMAKATQTLERAQAQGLVTLERSNELMAMATAQYGKMGGAVSDMTRKMSESTMANSNLVRGMSSAGNAAAAAAGGTDKYTNVNKLARYELINLGRQLQDVFVSLSSGQAPLTVAIQQGSQISDVFTSSGVSLSGFAKQIFGMIGPLGLIGIGVAAVAVGFAAAAHAWNESALQLDNLSKRTGTATGKLQDLRDLAAAKGIGTDEWAKGMESFGNAVNSAQRGVGGLADLFRLNGQTIEKDVLGNLSKVADLVKNARTEQDKLNVLQAAGLPATQEMVRLYEQGGEALRKAMQELDHANVNQDLIDSARKFDEAWNKAWAAFKTAGFEAVGLVLAALGKLAAAAKPILDKAGDVVKGVLGSARTRADELAAGGSIEDQLTGPPRSGSSISLPGIEVKPPKPTVTPEDLAAMERELSLLQQRKKFLGEATTEELRGLIARKEVQIARAKGVELSKGEADAFVRNEELDLKHSAKLKELKTDYRQVESAITSFGSTLINSMLDGATATAALGKALEGLGKQLINVGIKDFATSISKDLSSSISSLVPALGSIGGPLGTAALGVGVSLIGKLFGQGDDAEAKKQQAAQQKAAEELQRAKDAWAGMSDEVEAFNRAAAGFSLGALSKSIQDLFQQSAPLLRAARAANDAIGSAEISATLASGLQRLLREFAADLPALITEFGKTTGPLAAAKAEVKALMDSFRDLNSSLLEFQTRTLSDQSQAFIELNTAGRAAVLALLDVSPPLSEIATKAAELVGKAGPMQNALVDLGLSAEDAATAINEKLIAALDVLRGGFMDELIKQVNELAGGAWINQATELMTKVAQLRSDAAALGIQTGLINEFYIRSAQKIIDENELTGDSYDRLVAQLQLGGAGLHEFAKAVEDTSKVIKRSVEDIGAAFNTNSDRLFNALHRTDSLQDQLARFDLTAQREREAEVKAGGEAIASLEAAQMQDRVNIILDFNQKQLEAQQAADKAAADAAQKARDDELAAQQKAAEERQRVIDEATEFLTGALQNVANWIQHFLAGSASPLSPSARLASAQSSFATQKSAALGGDRDALSGITQNAQDVIDATIAYYGSSAAGKGLINDVISQLQGLPDQTSAEQFIVDGLTTPINTVATTITTQTDTLTNQLDALQSAVQSGSASATAAALLPMFDRLDANSSGGLDYNEFRAGLAGMASDYQLREMFTRLDTDNSGSLSRLELINQSTSNTRDAVVYTNSLLNAVLTTIEYLKSIDRHVSFCDHLQSIVAWQPGSSHAMGGKITGGYPGKDSVHSLLTPGEVVIREPVARTNPWLTDFNRTGNFPANDNGNVTNAISRMERSLLLGIRALIETQLQSAGIIARPIEEANKLQRSRRGEKKTA